jgi:hypothetical protein
MRLPRFHIRTLMVVTAVTALVCAVVPTLWLISPAFRSHSWGGGKEGMPLSIAVLDDVTGKPIAGVVIQVSPRARPDLRRDLTPVEGTTGADGVVRLTTIARAWGRRWTANWEGFQPVELWKTEDVSMSGVSIQAAAPGYEQAQWSLVKNPGRSPVTIRLRPSISTDMSLRRQ